MRRVPGLLDPKAVPLCHLQDTLPSHPYREGSVVAPRAPHPPNLEPDTTLVCTVGLRCGPIAGRLGLQGERHLVRTDLPVTLPA